MGYAAIHEEFDEKRAIRIMALMANVSLLAPLLGPLLGAWIISFAPWQSIFSLNANLALVALVGLWFTMPETLPPSTRAASLQIAPHLRQFIFRLGHQYQSLLRQRLFWRNSLTPALMITPTLVWIGLGPMVLMQDFRLSSQESALWQVPVFSALIAANLFLAYITGRWPLQRSLIIGQWLAGFAVAMGLLLVFTLGPSVWLLALVTALIGIVEGLSMSVYYRFAHTGSQAPKGILAAAVSMVFMLVSVAAIEAYKWVYVRFALPSYFVCTALLMVGFILLARRTVHANTQIRQDNLNPDEMEPIKH